MEAQIHLQTVCITSWIKLILDFLYRDINFSKLPVYKDFYKICLSFWVKQIPIKILIKILLCMLETSNPFLGYFLYATFFFECVIQCFIIFGETLFMFILILKRFYVYFIIYYDHISSMRTFLFDAG